jgi:hypothetical protein
MKSLFIGLFLIHTLCFCQQKKDSKVIVSVTDTSGIFNRVALYLVNRGYSLDRKDKEIGYISTQSKKPTKWRPEMKVLVIISGSQLTITGSADVRGRLSIDGLGSSGIFDQIVFTGKNTTMRDCWDELVEIGKQFGSITFSR